MSSTARPPAASWDERIVSDLYHAIAQPLTALRCALDLALRKPLEPAGYRKAIRTAIDAQERVVQAIAEARQIADAAAPAKPEALDLAIVLNEVLDDFEPVAHTHSALLSRKIPGKLPIVSDEMKLRLLLFLLLDEAIHHGGGGAIEVDCLIGASSVELRVSLPAGQLEFPNQPTASPIDDPAPTQEIMKTVLLRALHADLLQYDASLRRGFSLFLLQSIENASLESLPTRSNPV